ncbi:MAG: hypothetical protein M0R37_11120 [Bacteroidales bacterium]|jgi:hypothetical protein|nr:hypothetical protein [Bacteroidales bacterium]
MVKKRLLEFLAYLEVGQNAFEMKAGISNGYINNVKESIGTKIINKISAAFPELNIHWLLTGEGEMLNSGEKVNTNVGTKKTDAIFELICYIKERDRIRDMEIKEKDAKIEQLVRENAIMQTQIEMTKKVDAQDIASCVDAKHSKSG